MSNNSVLHVVFGAVCAGGVSAALVAATKARWIIRQSVEHPLLKSISSFVSQGSMAFLKREYRWLLPFIAVGSAFLIFANRGILRLQAAAFILGCVASALAGYVGMRVATIANSRTTHAAQKGLGPALRVSFAGGSVMGLSVVALAQIGILIVFAATALVFGSTIASFEGRVLPILSGFSLGASSLALFARVGGGIFTKAADVGADLVGKVEAGIPEDDHRNPATIADNVGDNVGDVAGMGADLFESYAGTIIGSMFLGAASLGSEAFRLRLAVLPLLLAVAGVAASIVGIRFVRTGPRSSAQSAMTKGTVISVILAAIFAFPICRFFIGSTTLNGSPGYLRIFFSALVGMSAGMSLGFVTEYFTGTNTRPVRSIARSCDTGAATAIITGMGVGMVSSLPPVIIIAASILAGSGLAGTYGIAIAALGMLMTLGIQLSVDAFGPIADNAGGLAEMAGMPAEVRQVTDELDAAGNTSAAVGKGFAIGSAALTSIIFFSAFRDQVGIVNIELTNTKVLAGILFGSVIPYFFSFISIRAISAAAFAMIEEVRRQFHDHPGILDETELPDYGRCVDIATSSALHGMLLPGIVAALLPVAIGFLGGPQMLAGTLVGVTASGVVFAVFMANSGGAWDNAKKMIESRADTSRGSDAHKAAVIGDTVGDPLKDAAGPSLNILIKLVGIVSLVIAPMLRSFWGL